MTRTATPRSQSSESRRDLVAGTGSDTECLPLSGWMRGDARGHVERNVFAKRVPDRTVLLTRQAQRAIELRLRNDAFELERHVHASKTMRLGLRAIARE